MLSLNVLMGCRLLFRTYRAAKGVEVVNTSANFHLDSGVLFIHYSVVLSSSEILVFYLFSSIVSLDLFYMQRMNAILQW